MAEEKSLLSVKEVSFILDVKRSRAYNIIKELNNSLEEEGYYTIRGRIPKKYLYERLGLSYGTK